MCSFVWNQISGMPHSETGWFFDCTTSFALSEHLIMAGRSGKTVDYSTIADWKSEKVIGILETWADEKHQKELLDTVNLSACELTTMQKNFLHDRATEEYIQALHYVVHHVIEAHIAHDVPLFGKSKGIAKVFKSLYSDGFFLRNSGNVHTAVLEQIDLLTKQKNSTNQLTQSEAQLKLDKINFKHILDNFVNPELETKGDGKTLVKPQVYKALLNYVPRVAPVSSSSGHRHGSGGDAAAALVVLFVMGFLPRFNKGDKACYTFIMEYFADSASNETWSNALRWSQLAEHAMLSGPLIFSAGKVSIVLLDKLVPSCFIMCLKQFPIFCCSGKTHRQTNSPGTICHSFAQVKTQKLAERWRRQSCSDAVGGSHLFCSLADE